MSLKSFSLIFSLATISLLSSCNFRNRDSDFKGTNLTQKELFSFSTWHYGSGNITLYNDTGEVSSKKIIPTQEASNLVFKLDENNSVLYRWKSDSIFHNENGHWKFNPKDSLINITFSNQNTIADINCKLIEVTNTNLVLQTVSYKDSTDDNLEQKKCKEVVTVWYFNQSLP